METPQNYAMNDTYMMQQGYPINSLEYHPQRGVIQQLMNFIMGKISPYQQRVEAPVWMYQADMNRIVASTQIANSMRQNDNMNPVMLSAMSSIMRGVGISDPGSYLYDASGQPSAFGNMVSSYIPKLFKLDTPWMNMGTSQVSLWNQMKGLSLVGDPNAIYRPGMGLSQFQSEELLTSLMRGTYSDSMLTKQRGLWGQRDIVEISGIARDYGVFRGASKDDLPRRIQDFGSIVSKSMMTFNTPDKESAVRMLIEATGGGIDLNNTSELRNTLDRIKGLSESANLSIQVLKSAIQRGQEVSKLMGLSTMTGTNMVMGAMTTLRSFGGDHSIPIGEKEALATVSDVTTQIQSSEIFTKATQMYGALLKYDPVAARSMEAMYFRKGEIPTTTNQLSDFRESLKKSLKARYKLNENQATIMADNVMEEESTRGTEEFSKNYYENYILGLGEQTMGTMIYNDKPNLDLYNRISTLRSQAGESDKAFVRSNFMRTSTDFLMKSRGMSRLQAEKVSSISWENYLNKERVLEDKDRRREAENIRRTREESQEYGRTTMGMPQKILNTLINTGGNLLSVLQASLASPESVMSLFNTSLDFNKDDNVQAVLKAHDEIYKTFDGELKAQYATNLAGGFTGSEWKDIAGTKLEDLKGYNLSDMYRNKLKQLSTDRSSVTASEVQLELRKQGINVTVKEALAIAYQVSTDKSKIESTLANAPKIREYARETNWDKFAGSEAYLQILRDAGADEKRSYSREEFRTLSEKSGQLQKYLAVTGSDTELEEGMKTSRKTVEHQLKMAAKEYAALLVEQEGNLKRSLMVGSDSFIKALSSVRDVKDINEIDPGGNRDTGGKLSTGLAGIFSDPQKKQTFSELASLYGKPYAFHQMLKEQGGWEAYITDNTKFAELYKFANKTYDITNMDVGTTIQKINYGRRTEAEHTAAKNFLQGKSDADLANILASQRKKDESEEDYAKRLTKGLLDRVHSMDVSVFKEYGNFTKEMTRDQKLETFRKMKGYVGMSELEMAQAEELSQNSTMLGKTDLNNAAVLYEAMEEKNKRLTKQLAPGMEKIINMMEKVTNFETLLSGIKDVLEQMKTDNNFYKPVTN